MSNEEQGAHDHGAGPSRVMSMEPFGLSGMVGSEPVDQLVAAAVAGCERCMCERLDEVVDEPVLGLDLISRMVTGTLMVLRVMDEQATVEVAAKALIPRLPQLAGLCVARLQAEYWPWAYETLAGVGQQERREALDEVVTTLAGMFAMGPRGTWAHTSGLARLVAGDGGLFGRDLGGS